MSRFKKEQFDFEALGLLDLDTEGNGAEAKG